MTVPSPPVPPDSDESKRVGSMREYAPYLTMGFQLAAAVVVFFFAGSWLDEELQTKPWCSIVGAAIGFVGGTIKFIKTAFELGRRESSGDR